MKFIWFHMQGYRDLPKDFEDRYESVWVTPPTDELCDPQKVHQYLNWNLDELDYAVGTLKLRAIMMASYVRRPIRAITKRSTMELR